MTDVLEETEVEEQTEEAVLREHPEIAPISADDPLARPVWAKIARTAMANSAISYYETIAKELGAPTVEELKESGHLTGTATSRYRLVMKIKKSNLDNDGRATAAEMRDHLRKLLKRNDESLMRVIEFRETQVDWNTAPPEAAEVTNLTDANPF